MLRPRKNALRQLSAVLAGPPRRHASTRHPPPPSSSPPPSPPSGPSFPCVDANESREASILASKQATRSTTNAAGPSFPCVDANETRAARLLAARRSQNVDRASQNLGTFSSARSRAEGGEESGPEPNYDPPKGYSVYHHPHLFPLDYGSTLPSFDIAYETWGTLSPRKDNVILLHTGLSASSHAKSHPGNPSPGWWESFLGPGPSYPIDTSRFFVVCTNVLGGCYGSTGPSSPDPTDPSGAPYATRFPIVSIWDMVRAQFKLLDQLGIEKLYASVGSSMGGMQSIAAAWLEPRRVGKVVSISGSARSGPSSIALRYAQRSVLMADPNWNRGFYYDSLPPHTGMKLARQIATITYRSGPEWEQRFARRRRGQPDPNAVASASGGLKGVETPVVPPVLCPDFLIETYLDHQGEQFCLKYDANSLLYVSKAMDLFDMTTEAIEELFVHRSGGSPPSSSPASCSFASPGPSPSLHPPPASAPAKPAAKPHVSSLPGTSSAYLPSLSDSLSKLSAIPTLILGAQSDVLFPVEQQRELAEALRRGGNRQVVYYELDSPFGHDTFLIDLAGVGGAIRGFLS